MANEFYTLIVVPHAKARFRKIQVSVRLTEVGHGRRGRGLALLLVGILIHYTRIARRSGRAAPAPGREPGPRHQDPGLRAERRAAPGQGPGPPEHRDEARRHGRAGAEPARRPGRRRRRPDQPRDQAPGSRRDPVHPIPGQDRQRPGREVVEAARSSSRTRQLLLASTPSVWPVRGYLSASFGNRIDPFTGQQDFHPGIDISTPIGTKVQAPADGVVIFCGVKGGYGNAIVIDHGYGIVTRYAHLAGFNVKPGQRVRRGDVIGFVGRPGARPRPTCTTRSGSTTRPRTPSTSSWTSTGPSARARGLTSRASADLRIRTQVCQTRDPAAILSGLRARVDAFSTPSGAIGVGRLSVLSARPGANRRKEGAAEAPREMINTILTKIIGTKNERELKRIRPLVQRIGELEPSLRAAQRRAARGEDRGVPGAAGHGARPSTTCCPRPSRWSARRAAACSTCGTSTSSSSAASTLHRGHDRRDEDRRGQDPRGHARRLPERPRGQGRPRRHRQRLPGQARQRLDGPDLPLPGPLRGRDPAPPRRTRSGRSPTGPTSPTAPTTSSASTTCATT